MRALLVTFSWQELRHHPWRNAAAVVAVMLGVALAFAVHLINASALDEFSQAVRSVDGQPDLELRAVHEGFDESAFALAAARPEVTTASPVLEVASLLRTTSPTTSPNTTQTQTQTPARSVSVRVLGVDALVLAATAPMLLPRSAADADRMAWFAPDTVFLNPAALQALGLAGDAAAPLTLQTSRGDRAVRLSGTVAATGSALAVMDIGAAQDLFGRGGQLTRIDLRLRPGTDRKAFAQALQATPGWPAGITVAEPGDAAERIGNLSRAYRVNLTVLALVALFTGAFLVFSVLALSVSKRAAQFALLGVLGLTPAQRLRLVLAESLVLGAIGSAAGIALGAGLAALALRVLGGDLGGGYFQGVAPRLHWSSGAALTYAALGLLAAGVGGWWPAQSAARLPPAQTLKGLGSFGQGAGRWWPGPLLALAGAALALAPPIGGVPLAAYISVALLLLGGIVALPAGIAAVYNRLAPLLAHRLLPMLAIERARRMRGTAAVAVSGVVASLALAVALTVMVASFRHSVTAWLDTVLPAQLYVRISGTQGNNSGGGARSDTLQFSAVLAEAVARLPGVQRANGLRTLSLLLDPSRPAVALIARDLDADPARSLPLVGNALAVPPGQVAIYVSEAMVDLYNARPGTVLREIDASFKALAQEIPGQPATFFVAGVWRDYARQFGAVVIGRSDFERLTGDRRSNDLAIWLDDGADVQAVEAAVRALVRSDAEAQQSGLADRLEFAATGQIRATSLRIFDRSFAVTYWLQGVAIAIGLFGVAASFSAQVLARRKEFGLLAHLGFTRRQILAVVAGEGAAWTAIGAVAGVVLGLAVAVVLVHVVNPQSFHWTMDLLVPWARLALLCTAVVAAGTATAWLAGRAAAGRDAVLAVKEDW